MPVPTDTFWNIKRLNRVFALTSVLLVGVTFWAVIQDYDKDWRIPQQHGKVWEAALTEEKIHRDLTPEKQAQIAKLDKQIAGKDAEIESKDADYKKDIGAVRKLESDQADMEFKINSLKANVGVLEGNYQDAVTAGDQEKADSIMKKLAPGREQLNHDLKALEDKKNELKEARGKLADKLAVITALKKERTKLAGDAEALKKKEESLEPTNPIARLSTAIRRAPLAQFMNPAEKVNQIVLPDVQTDVAFMKITTVDRCMTCHVNIANKEFSVEKVLGYLEEQTATGRHYRYAARDPAKPAPTADKPGPTAMPEFWQAWARKLLTREQIEKTTKFPVQSIVGAAGKTIEKVEYNGQPVSGFKPATQPSQDDLKKQDAILVATLNALYHEDPDKTPAAVKTARTAALAYPDRIRALLKTNLSEKQFRLLEDRYRYALVAEVNTYRKKQGYSALDPSPVMLAHPQLNLYVDVDSKHSYEAVGCTSCHDGSGQETDFVVAAHTPRAIWVDEKTGEPVLPASLDVSKIKQEERPPDLSSMLSAVFPEGSVSAKSVRDIHLDLLPQNETREMVQDAPEDAPPTIYIDPVTGKAAKAVPQFTYWKATYEPNAPRDFELVYHEWDWPMRTPEFIQANCVRCHTNVGDIRDEAPVVYEGRYLFANLGCVNCHQMDSIPANEQRRVAPDLRHVTAKLSPAMINTWIWAPKAFRPSTKMPHFFMLENNSSDEDLRRTRQEVRAITEYLVQTATPLEPKYKVGDLKGSAAAGKEVFTSIGCQGCHANLNETGEAWITTDLVKGQGKTAAEAKTIFASMDYNTRQLYAYEHLSPAAPTNYLDKMENGVAKPVWRYADATPTTPGTPKPVFVRQGPELSGIGTKLTAGRTVEQARQWIFDWLKEPRHYSEYTVMPRLRLTDQQAADVAEYLLAQKRTVQDPKDKWNAGLTDTEPEKLTELTAQFLKAKYTLQTAMVKATEDAELTPLAIDALTTPAVDAAAATARVKKMSVEQKQLVFLGKKLLSNYGCMTCHAINGLEGVSSPCANLSDWGQKQVSKLDYGYIDPHKVENLPETSKLEMVNGLSVEAANMGHEKIDWAKAHLAAPVDVAWPRVEHTRDSWINQKLKNTRVWDRGKINLDAQRDIKGDKDIVTDPGKPYDKLKMPTFYLNDEQVHAIVVFVLSNRDRLITPSLTLKTETEEAKKIARGRAVVESYNCVGCHSIEKNWPQVQQYFPNDQIMTKAPPSLRGEGNKIQHAWLFNFFFNVEPLRPLPVIHMPSFPWTDEEATAVAAYFNAVSVKESNDLKKQLEPVLKYVAGEQEKAKLAAEAASKKSATQPADLALAAKPPVVLPGFPNLGNVVFAGYGAGVDASAAQPGDDWHAKPQFETAANMLKDWALTFKQTTNVDVDPARNSPAALGKSYRTILYKAVFTAGLYDAPFPFVESPRPEITDERFHRGEEFFHEMQCLSCHFMGDPKAPGAVKEPKAPNLGLAYRRLQRRWVRHWVQEPPVIQAATSMPQFFSGLSIFKVDGQDWADAQGLPAAKIKESQDKYGKTVDEQTDLLLDFLYAAGVRNYTSVAPAKPAPPKVTLKPQSTDRAQLN
jgi:cbb3-type cytochrome oxidase cytochrome c subunit